MIDLKVTTIGGPEIAAKLSDLNSDVRANLVTELEEIGKDVVYGARNRVPRRTGYLMSRILYRMGRETKRGGWMPFEPGILKLTVLPGEPLAHLVERGVDTTVTKARAKRSENVYTVRGRGKRERRSLVAQGVAFGRKPYRLVIKPRPYFMPAVEAVGDVGPRLQAVIDRTVSAANGGG